MIKLFKGLLFILAVICIAFTAFFFYSYATGNTGAIEQIESVIGKVPVSKASESEQTPQSTVGMVSREFGLTTSQAGQVISFAKELGIDVTDSSEVGSFISKNAKHVDEIKSIVEGVQAGTLTEAQAKARLSGIIGG